MKRLLQAEYRKTRGRYLLLTVLGITAAEVLWLLSGKLNEDGIAKGWMVFLYQMPLINALFLPVLAMVVSSRLGDLEHKNAMMKELCCIVERKKLFNAKLLYGCALLMFSTLILFAAVVGFGFWKHFGGSFPAKSYLLLYLFTVFPSIVLYLIQHALSLCCEKTAVPFIVGIMGEFIGVLSMFLPQIPVLRKIVPWGYYGVMMFVGCDYDRATRISTFYYMDIDWGGFILIVIVGILCYLAGKKVFCRLEVTG